MINDEIVWNVLNQSFCAFKKKTRGQILCRNPHNLVGVCSFKYCPLAKSQYATVREIQGKVYLMIKTIERAHTPAKAWESILLSTNIKKAVAQIEEALEWWPKYMIERCKERVVRYKQYLRACRRAVLQQRTKLVRINKKDERRLEKRELKALRAAKLDMHIKEELLARLKDGRYASQIPAGISEEKMRELIEEEIRKEMEEQEQEIEEEVEEEGQERQPKYVFDRDEDDDDEINNIGADYTDSEEEGSLGPESDEEDEEAPKRKRQPPPTNTGKRGRGDGGAASAAGGSSSGAGKAPKKRRVHIEIEREVETPQQQINGLLDW